MTRVFLSPPHMGGDELNFINEAFATNWISPAGPHIDAFENELCQYNGIEYCAALSSGTAAIHLALIILGVGREDEVLCSDFTFAGSCNPIAYLGARPVFIDSERDSWNMDPNLLEEAIKSRITKTGKKPKAIIAVHLYGMPAMIDKIMEIARQYEIPVIEDAAEGLGSVYQGKKLGTFGDIGVYSFNGNKIITTSGGGAMVSKNKAWVDQAKFLATQARDAAPHYEHTQIGYNYRLSNVTAAIGRGQLKVIDQRVEQRRSNFVYYANALQALPGISFQPEMEGAYSNRWLTTILIDPGLSGGTNREKVRLLLETENIESRPLWKPMHLQPVYHHAVSYEAGVSKGFFENGLCLPSGSNLNEETLNRITQIIKNAWQ